MSNPLLEAALQYHDEGLNVIPVVYRDKKPDLLTWEEYQNRVSTLDEVKGWFGNGHRHNIGLVHCTLKNGLNYVAIDIDHDSGVCDEVWEKFGELFRGRIEQSGSGEGYHVPLLIDTAPDWGNKTWKTPNGNVNLRIAGCQTVAPPSIHPTGGQYRYLQDGPITRTENLDHLIEWLNEITPTPVKSPPPTKKPIRQTNEDTLLEAVKAAWPTCLSVFSHWGMANQIEVIKGGQTFYLRGYGGLKLDADGERWFIFCEDFGGGLFEAWGYCRFGNTYDKRKHFRQVLLEMAQAAGIDVAKFYKRGDEAKTESPQTNTRYWAEQYSGYWQLAR